MAARIAEIKRKTKETDIVCTLSIDGSGAHHIDSGNGFFDHMLTLWTSHGTFDCDLVCTGDTHVDMHHSVEDVGIVLGNALGKALGEKRGITRFATCHLPMDESLSRVCIDLGGRSNLVYDVSLIDRTINDFECDLVHDFFKAFSDNARCTIHVDLLRGRNSHHSIESIFKAFGRALRSACAIDQQTPDTIPSTKGVL